MLSRDGRVVRTVPFQYLPLHVEKGADFEPTEVLVVRQSLLTRRERPCVLILRDDIPT